LQIGTGVGYDGVDVGGDLIYHRFKNIQHGTKAVKNVCPVMQVL